MTTIATDGKSMAADGQSEACRTIISRGSRKVIRLSDGSLLGLAGEPGNRDTLAKWLIEGGAKPKLSGCLSALRLFPDGRLHYISERCDPVEIEAPVAVGSGMDFAIGALEAGASLRTAVEIACRRDPGSGGEITMLTLEAALQAAA